MEDSDESAPWMYGDINREIAEIDLFANRAQRPLIWEQNGAVRLFARQN
jgi:hypothetical protein